MTAVRLLGLPLHLFTTDPTATRLSALPRHRVRPSARPRLLALRVQASACMPVLPQVTVRAVAELNRRRPTLVVLPSGESVALPCPASVL